MRWLILIVVLACMSCRTTSVEYVPVDRVKTEFRYLVKHDSVHIRDSVFIQLKGDTVFTERWHVEFRDRWRRDTITRADSIPLPYPVERKLSKWEQTKVHYGGYALGCTFAVILIVFGRLIYKIKKG